MITNEYRVKAFNCPACGRIGAKHNHHIDYDKPTIIEVCAACHKKIHMYLNGTVRTGSNPYKNPLVRLGYAAQ